MLSMFIYLFQHELSPSFKKWSPNLARPSFVWLIFCVVNICLFKFEKKKKKHPCYVQNVDNMLVFS